MYFLTQIISTLFGIKANRKVMTEKDEVAGREQRRNETGGWRKEEEAAIKRQSRHECQTAWSLGDLVQWL